MFLIAHSKPTLTHIMYTTSSECFIECVLIVFNGSLFQGAEDRCGGLGGGGEQKPTFSPKIGYFHWRGGGGRQNLAEKQ